MLSLFVFFKNVCINNGTKNKNSHLLYEIRCSVQLLLEFQMLINLKMKDYTQIENAFCQYFSALKKLQELGVSPNKKDFTSQIGEWLVMEIYNGERAKSGIQKDWDLKIDNKFVQVKTHSKANTTSARWTSIKYGEKAEIDELITVIFTSDYKLKEFYMTPWVEAFKLIRRQKHDDVIYWDDQKAFRIEIDNLPNQPLISLFK